MSSHRHYVNLHCPFVGCGMRESISAILAPNLFPDDGLEEIVIATPCNKHTEGSDNAPVPA